MAVVIRLSRIGGKGKPYYRLVVADSRKAVQSGTVIEQIGSYDPRAKSGFSVDLKKADAWIEKGARMSPTVSKLVKKARESAVEKPVS